MLVSNRFEEDLKSKILLKMELLQEFTWLVRVSLKLVGAIFADVYKQEIKKIMSVFYSHL